MMTKKLPAKIAIITLMVFILGACVYVSLELRQNSIEDKSLKRDYFLVNQIKYGMLSGENWSYQVNRIIEMQVDSFSFTGENKKILAGQINGVLLRLFDELDSILHQKQERFTDRLKFKVINAFVDLDKFKSEIPRFSRAILDEIDKPKNKAQLKKLLKDKITGILNATNQDLIGEQQFILHKYPVSGIPEFNKLIAEKTSLLQNEQRTLGFTLIAFLLLTLLLWIMILRAGVLLAFSFSMSVLISFTTLFIGVSLPMIEIDARIATLDLSLLSSHIIFNDQVIFFQTKSILDVIHILLTDGKTDTVFVGFLILLFSVLFPTLKLVCACIFIFVRKRKNAFIYYMAFKSGKWSMADVMVVAIFMAYVGFQGILNNQLEDIDMKNETVNIVTTNKSGLQTGFLIFVTFVLFNLVLAEILKLITKRRERESEEKP